MAKLGIENHFTPNSSITNNNHLKLIDTHHNSQTPTTHEEYNESNKYQLQQSEYIENHVEEIILPETGVYQQEHNYFFLYQH